MLLRVHIPTYTQPLGPRPSNVPLVRALWSLVEGIWGVEKGSWGVLGMMVV